MPEQARRFGLSQGETTGICALLAAALLAVADPLWAVPPLLVFLLLCLAAPFWPQASFFLPVISSCPPGAGGIVLTFDDGPSPASTPILLELLARYQLPATFFVIGRQAAAHPELIRAIVEAGHTVGNHSWRHDSLLMLRSAEAIRKDIHAAQEACITAGAQPLVFRPPIGITGPRLRRALGSEDLLAVAFSCRALDRGNRRIRQLARRIAKKVRPGDIIMLHDLPAYKDEQAEMLRRELDRLFRVLAERHRVIPLAEAIQHPVMRRC
jgi:peptidoglycan/xylan/chitin deacetylase (PgdA/CDA1 family)